MKAVTMKAYTLTHRGFRVLRLKQEGGISLDLAGRFVEIIEAADAEWASRQKERDKDAD